MREMRVPVVLLVVSVAWLSSCADRVIDLSQASEMQRLVGACIELTREGELLPPRSGKEYLLTFGSTEEDKLPLFSGDRFTVVSVTGVHSFDGVYLFISARAQARDGLPEVIADVSSVLDNNWLRHAMARLREGEIPVLSADLPLKHARARDCSAGSAAGELAAPGP